MYTSILKNSIKWFSSVGLDFPISGVLIIHRKNTESIDNINIYQIIYSYFFWAYTTDVEHWLGVPLMHTNIYDESVSSLLNTLVVIHIGLPQLVSSTLLRSRLRACGVIPNGELFSSSREMPPPNHTRQNNI